MKRIVKWAANVFYALLFGSILLVTFALLVQSLSGEQLPKFFGWSNMVVLTGSMEPAIMPGDMVIAREEASYEAGDIVAYPRDGMIITHRIIETGEDWAVTKGDHNSIADEPISLGSIEGKILVILPAVGNIALALRTPLGIALLVGAALLLLFLPPLLKRLKRKRKTPAPSPPKKPPRHF